MQYFNVQGMTCQHCVRAVSEAIQSQDAKARVDVDLAANQVAVDSELPVERILRAIQGSGYLAQPRGEVK